jgi:hypothetical protein
VRFEVFVVVRMLLLLFFFFFFFFWVLVPCRLVGRCQMFGETYCPEDGDGMFLRNVGIYLWVYLAPKLRTSSSKLVLSTTVGFEVLTVVSTKMAVF